MMVVALRSEFSEPMKEEDRPRYRAALERLPKGSTATPRVVFVSPYDQKTDLHWRVTFTGGSTRYEAHGALARWLRPRPMQRTSWRGCGERPIGPDGHRLTNAAHHFRSRLARPLSSSAAPRRWRMSCVDLGAPITTPRAPKDVTGRCSVGSDGSRSPPRRTK